MKETIFSQGCLTTKLCCKLKRIILSWDNLFYKVVTRQSKYTDRRYMCMHDDYILML